LADSGLHANTEIMPTFITLTDITITDITAIKITATELMPTISEQDPKPITTARMIIAPPH